MRLALVSLLAAACGGTPAASPVAASPVAASPVAASASRTGPRGREPHGCGGGPRVAQIVKAKDAGPAPRMDSFTRNGYELTGAEYWPYVGSVDIKYPEEVLWGFYPEAGVIPPGETAPNPATARPEVIACAHSAFAALQAFIASDPPALRRVIELGAIRGDIVPRFYLWTNDYGRAAAPYPPGRREARLWYWKRKQPAPPKPPGYWKWESVLTQAGECQIPRAEQIAAFLAQMTSELERPRPR